MIRSMTGYGAVQHVEDGVSYALEIRSLNNRYLKLSIKVPEHLQFLESDIEKLVRNRIARGSIGYALRVRGEGAAALRSLDPAALQWYVEQLSRARTSEGVQTTIDLATVAQLPGVCESPELAENARTHQLDFVTDLTNRAIDILSQMRGEEGVALRADLLKWCQQIGERLAECNVRAPKVVEEYHERLKSRVASLMQAGGFELEAEGLMREVAIFAERCDISEEIVRLTSHLDQFVQLCDSDDQVGRTLDFLTQEMLREANTIASKANDAQIAQAVVQIKGLIDRLKEQAQNAE